MSATPRVYISSENWREEGFIEVPSGEWHHLMDVLRHRPGDPVILFDGEGREGEGRIADRSLRQVQLLRQWTRPENPVGLVLYQAVLKQEAMDTVIRKAVELGVRMLCPIEAERSIPRLLCDRSLKRRERWKILAIEAARQCAIARIPEITPVVSLESVLEELSALDGVFIGSLKEGARPLLVEAWPLVDRLRSRGSLRVGLLIGPEGDWTPAEHERLVRAGARPVSFGENILRADTAACYGLSVLGALFTAGDEIRRPVPHG